MSTISSHLKRISRDTRDGLFFALGVGAASLVWAFGVFVVSLIAGVHA